MKIGGGMLTPDGQFVRDPFATRERELTRFDRLIGAERDDILAAERAEIARQDRLDREAQRNRDSQRDYELRESLAQFRMRGGSGQQAGSFSQSGFTPQGQQVVTNTKSGVSYVLSLQPDGTPNYTPIRGR